MTAVSLVFQEHQEKRVLRVTWDCQVPLGSLGWQGFQVPWDQLDRQDPLAHQGHRAALVIVTRMNTRQTTAFPGSMAHLDLRVHLVSQVYLVGQVCQVIMETKEQRDQVELLGFQVSTGSQDSRVQRETVDREESRVCQGEVEGFLDLQVLPVLQDKPPTRRAMEGMVFLVEQDSQGPQDQKETRETQVLQDMHREGRKESLVSSWGLMGNLSTSGVWQDGRAMEVPLALRDLQVLLVLQDRRERLGYQVDLVDRG